MKKIISIFLLSYIFAAPITEELAVNIAENFYFSKNDPRDNTFSIESIELYSIDQENVFYIIELSPKGFMLISYDNLIRPVLEK